MTFRGRKRTLLTGRYYTKGPDMSSFLRGRGPPAPAESETPGLRRYGRITIENVGVAPTSFGRVKALYN